MDGQQTERRGGHGPDGVDRRQRKPDMWRRVLNGLTYVVYPLLLINLFIFMGMNSMKQKDEIVQKMEDGAKQVPETMADIPQEPVPEPPPEPAPAVAVGRWVHLHAFMPLMAAGVALGVAGIVLDRKRARRRSDSSLMTPLVLVILSVAGFFIYLLAGALMMGPK